MNDLANYLSPHSMKGESADAANWTVRNQEFTFSKIRLAIKDVLPSSMQDNLEDHQEDYYSLTFEDWCDLLSKIEVKYERRRAATQIKKIASAMSASLYDSDKSTRNIGRNKASTGIRISNNAPQKKAYKHHGSQKYCVLYKKEGITDHNYMSHIAKDCTGMRTKRTIKDGMGGSVGGRADTVKQYKKS